MEVGQRETGGDRAILGDIPGLEDAREPIADQRERTALPRDDTLTRGALGGPGGEIDLDHAEIAIEPEGLEVGGGHHHVAGPARVDAVAALELEAIAVLGARLEALGEHRPVDIGESHLLGLGHFDVDVAELQKSEVERLPGTAGRLHPRRDGVDGAGGTEHDAGTGGLEGLHDLGLVLTIVLADRLLERHVAEVVHAVAGGGDGRLEAQDIILHPPEESARGLAAPTVLPAFHLEVGPRGGEVCLEQAAVHLLLCDGVTADRVTVARLE